MARPMSKSFYEWCIENDRIDILELWDYTLNKVNPKDVAYSSHKKYWFKCPKGIHKSEEKALCNITNKMKLKCNQCNSFKQWCLDNNHKSWLELWDYELNEIKPEDISYGSTKRCWFKCSKGIHSSELKIICNLVFRNISLECNQCNFYSFEQWCLDNKHEDWLVLWDYKLNQCNPNELSYSSHKKCWFKCPRGIHSSELKTISDLSSGHLAFKCKQCNSFGQYLIDTFGENALERYWSKNNIANPFEITLKSPQKIWFICQNNKKHKDYKSNCYNFIYGNRCPECKESKGEKKIRKYLNTHNIDFISQKEFPDLLGVSEWKPLSYDFYIPEQNLLIEYQGEYHDGTANNQTEEEFIKQQEHDKRKREYAKLHNINLLEIWYYNFNNIEEILNKNIK